MGYESRPSISFSDRELVDLGVAWVALSVAFAIFLNPGSGIRMEGFAELAALSFLTVGVGFLLHELAHKVVAIRFGQLAEFRADYRTLFVMLMLALIGVLFAAPGAVYHRGRITVRENGLIALAGPATNHALAALFLPLVFLPDLVGAPAIVGRTGQLGVWINLFLAAFNMLPFGPLDGKSVYRWSKLVFALVFVPSLVLALYVIFFVGLG